MLIHTTPALDVDASMYLTSATFPLVRSYTIVGLDFISVYMHFQSRNSLNAEAYFPNETRFGCDEIDLLNVVQRPFPAGKPIYA